MAVLIFEVTCRLVSEEVINALYKKSAEEGDDRVEIPELPGISFCSIQDIMGLEDPIKTSGLERARFLATGCRYPITKVIIVRKGNIPDKIEKFQEEGHE
jgi:hypothetical protein